MNFTQDQIAAIVGSMQLELIGLRIQLAQVQAQLKELQGTLAVITSGIIFNAL